MLLANGADVDARDKYGRTSLHHAVARGCSADAYVYRPITAEEEKRCKEFATLLLDAKADIGSKDLTGRTPLHTAVERYVKSCVLLLCERSADVNARDKYGLTPLHLAAKRDTRNANAKEEAAAHLEIAKILLARSADVDAVDGKGRTPLRLAADNNLDQIADLLRQHGLPERSKANENLPRQPQ